MSKQEPIYYSIAQAGKGSEREQEYVQTAVSRFQSSLDIRRRIGDESGAADTLGELGKLLMDAGQLDEAIAAFNEALATYRKLGNPIKSGMVIEFLGNVHELQGQYTAALSKYHEALALLQQYGSPRDIAITQKSIARIQFKISGDIYIDARRLFARGEWEKALDAFRSIQDNYPEKAFSLTILYDTGRIHHKLNNYELARQYYRDSLRLAMREKNTSMLVNIKLSLGKLYIQVERWSEAAKNLEDSLTHFNLSDNSEKRQQIETLLNFAKEQLS